MRKMISYLPEWEGGKERQNTATIPSKCYWNTMNNEFEKHEPCKA